MRSAFVSAPMLLIALFFVAVGAPSCSDNATTPLTISGPTAAYRPTQALYGGCPTDLDATCRSFHGPYSVATGSCAYEACFEMAYGREVRVVAADELGDFPKTWFAWHEGTMAPAGGIVCGLTEEGKKKTRVEIPVDQFRCKVDLTTSERVYHEHFASNPTSGCLGWLECTEIAP